MIYRFYNDGNRTDVAFDDKKDALLKFITHANLVRDGYANDVRMTVQRDGKETEIMRMTREAIQLIQNDEDWKGMREAYKRERNDEDRRKGLIR